MSITKLFDKVESRTNALYDHIHKHLGSYYLVADYVKFNAKTPDEYQKWKEELATLGIIVEEQAQQGSEQTVVKLFEPIETKFNNLLTVVAVEPIPNIVVDQYGLAEIGLVADNLTKLLEAERESRLEFFEDDERQPIDGIKVVKYPYSKLQVLILRDSHAKEVMKRNQALGDQDELNQLRKELQHLQQFKIDLRKEQDAKLKLMADFQNYRKRIEAEKSRFGLQANKQIVDSVIDVVDDVLRTIEDQDKDVSRCDEMFGIVKDKLLATVRSNGIEMLQIKVGDEFDSQVMEAVSTVPVSEVDQHNRVVSVIQPAYRYSDNDQILRTAKVIVGKKQ